MMVARCHVWWLGVACTLGAACASPPAPMTSRAGAASAPAVPTGAASTGALPASPPSASSAPGPSSAPEPPAREPSTTAPIWPEVALHEVSFKIQKPPHTSLGHEWKAGRGLDWITFEKGPHQGESIFIATQPGIDVTKSVEQHAKPDPSFTRGVIDSWFEGDIGVVDMQYSFKDAIDCRTTPGCNRHVIVVQKIGSETVECFVTDYSATDDWARTVALQVCKTLVP